MASQYSSSMTTTLTTSSFIFNIIVGTGALTIPYATSNAGYVLSSIIILLFAFTSYITVTFLVETMAISNAILLIGENVEENENVEDSEEEPLITSNQISAHSFEMDKTIELGQMCQLFFGRIGQLLFYGVITVYLYGDLAIYVTAISKSLRDIICNRELNTTNNCNDYLTPYVDRTGTYRLCTILFILLIGPFSFIPFSKTKYLQLFTTLFRWVAFLSMIYISIGKIDGINRPKLAVPLQLPMLFGTCVYSFMCHHSIPSLLSGFGDKKNVNRVFFIDYSLIATFYIVLSVTAVFAFPTINDLYTLNFINEQGLVAYMLPLFPVFTLSTNFPIISITLKNNLKTLFQIQSEFSNGIYTLLAILPPLVVSFFVSDVQWLVNFTGSFAGGFIQYVIPALLVSRARNKIGLVEHNPYGSPFKGDFWVFFVLIWCFVSVSLVIVHMVF